MAVPPIRARDLLLAPSLLSAARLPLAAAFPFAIRHTALALGLIGAATLTDVLDGYVARRFRLATPTGAIVDGFADKIFGLSVLSTLVASRLLAPGLAVLLATREIGELPLALRVLTRRTSRPVTDWRANRLGKTATALEFAAVVAVLLRIRHPEVIVGAAAGVGIVAAASYWRREIRAARAARATNPTGAHRSAYAP